MKKKHQRKDHAKQNLLHLKYLRRRYKEDPAFKKKIIKINRERRRAVQQKSRTSASNNGRPWSVRDIKRLKSLSPTSTNLELSLALNRTYDSIRKTKQLLGIRRNKKWGGKY